MAKQPDTSDDKDEANSASFIETMRRLLRVKKEDVVALGRKPPPTTKRPRSAPPKRKIG